MKKFVLIPAIAALSFIVGFTFNTATTNNNGQQENPPLKRVTGIGGIFFKCKEPKKVKEWYQLHLGLNTDQYGTSFEWRPSADSSKKAYTQWSPFSEKTKYFAPSTKDFMINYRVENLEALVDVLKKEGVTICDTLEKTDYGNFIHIMDLEGNKIELWQPIDHVYAKSATGITK
jgi:predicted enzyme related to lactoylglutathione lyase